ncbi:MAG: flagellar protein FlaG [Deltaproteobacteria bacterium]|nr:flagellar protein FlaG [Deltaproteobacteria bacterium]
MMDIRVTGRADIINQVFAQSEQRASAVQAQRRAQNVQAERQREGVGQPAQFVESLKDTAQGLEKALKGLGAELKIEIDRDSNSVVVKVIDSTTNEVIKQIPSEELIEIRKRVQEMIDGYSKRPETISLFEAGKAEE